MSTLAEQLRALRRKVYGECSDGNWEACKENWMRPDSVEWLKEHAGLPPLVFAPVGVKEVQS